MARSILISGGAGFIGSHLADNLLQHGCKVRALDSMAEQVHGASATRPAYLHRDVDLQTGDIRDPQAVRRALQGIDVVYHLAAAVGVGQSMYQIAHYTQVNNGGTAVLLEALIERPVERLIVASSMSIYGEGMYRGPDGAVHPGGDRSLEQCQRGQWEVRGPAGEVLEPLPTPEGKPPSLASIYALSKFDQERMCLLAGRAYNIPTVALRLFNVYGPRQALSNPYTGVLAIFASRLLNNQPPLIFEDGRQQRDFVNVRDIAEAFRLAMAAPAAPGQAINIGSGRHYTIRAIAERMAAVLDRDIAPTITGKYRVGDIRHCFADISLAREVLGYQPQVGLEDGLRELAGWLQGQQATDRLGQARAELEARGLTV